MKIFFWPPIHKFLVVNKKIVNFLFSFTTILVGVLIPLGYYLFDTNLELFLVISKVANKFGTIALFLFLGTLIPGILKRFKVLPLFSASIALFRRQMGILMFLVGILHSSYLSTIPAVMTSRVGFEFMQWTDIAGVVTLMILFPVWLTSNDLSMRKFGVFWKTLQRLTYFALISIFLHVAWVATLPAVLTFIVLALELASWIKVWSKNK
jgi:DMSO/TMAO reductase YedYZ heme-binding membrane subunit